MDQHSYSFFGQSSAMFFDSGSKSDPYLFLRFIKKKGGRDAEWEKPSRGEGKAVRLSLEETLCLLNVLKQKQQDYKTYHTYKNDSTNISFRWDNVDFWANINGSGASYHKKLSAEQVELFAMLLEHVLTEKIEYSTGSNYGSEVKSQQQQQQQSNHSKQASSQLRVEQERYPSEHVSLNSEYHLRRSTPVPKGRTVEKPFPSDNNNNSPKKIVTRNTPTKDKSIVQARIVGMTQKALFLSFPNGQEKWYPKSTIHSEYDEKDETVLQSLTIDDWILKKNRIM